MHAYSLHSRNRAMGDVDAQSALALLFDKIDVASTAFAPFTINISGPPDPATAALLQRLKLSLTFRGNAGQFVIAPYGQPTGIDTAIQTAGSSIGIGVGAAILGLLLIGKAVF